MKKLIILLLVPALAFAATLEWNRNPETNVNVYVVYRSKMSNTISPSGNTYFQVASVTNVTAWSLTNEPTGIHWYRVTAADDSGLESEFSDAVSWTNRPSRPNQPKIF